MILKKGSAGPEVADLVAKLRQLGFSLSASGDRYDADVRNAVEAFQSSGLDSVGEPLAVDGVLGPHTLWAIEAALRGYRPAAAHPKVPPLPDGGNAAGRDALAFALQEAEAGHGEVGGNNRGPHVRKYLNGLASEGSSWCAGFVSWCFFQARGEDMAFQYKTGAKSVHNQMKAKRFAYTAAVSNPPQPGDIIVWNRTDPEKPDTTYWQGHVGIVYGFVDGYLWTVEGNRTAQVGVFKHSWVDLVASVDGDRFKGVFGLSRHP